MHNISEVTTDVLVIGGGAAGGLAALEAQKKTDDVMIAVKGLGGKSGNTPMAEGGVQATFHLKDSIEEHVKDTLKAGKYINDPLLVKTLAQKAPSLLKVIEEYGVSFKKNDNGDYFQFATSGSSYPRCLWINGGGASLARNIFDHVKKSNIVMIEDIMITKLLVSGGHIAGAVGLDYKNGKIVVIRAKAVVIATGGNERLYYFSDGSVDSTGDGNALAFEAGVELINMEFIQFYPHALVWPEALKGTIITEEVYYDNLIGARLLNGQFEEFTHKYDPVNKEKTTRDILARAILTEIEEGRGSEHGGVIINVTGCNKKDVLYLIGPLYNYLKKNGVDILKSPLEVAPSAHYQCGGIRIDKDGGTNIKGLYAAGECCGGFDGANRLSSNALTEAVVFGIIAGANAGLYASRSQIGPVEKDQIKKAINEIMSIVNNQTKKGLDVLNVKNQLQRLMTQKVGLIRHKEGLEEALSLLMEIRDIEFGRINLSDKSLVCNLELIQALELKSLIENAILVTSSALFRCESRGSHYRVDFPKENNEVWRKHTLITKTNNSSHIQSLEIEMDMR